MLGCRMWFAINVDVGEAIMSLLQSMNISWCLSFALLLFKLSFPFESTEPIFASTRESFMLFHTRICILLLRCCFHSVFFYYFLHSSAITLFYNSFFFFVALRFRSPIKSTGILITWRWSGRSLWFGGDFLLLVRSINKPRQVRTWWVLIS